jgi:hypothetical protein
VSLGQGFLCQRTPEAAADARNEQMFYACHRKSPLCTIEMKFDYLPTACSED